MDLGKYKLPFNTSNSLLWIVVVFVILGFGNNRDLLGINFLRQPKRMKYANGRNNINGHAGGIAGNKNEAGSPIMFGNGSGFLGGNGLFLIALVAIIFICKKDKKTQDCVEDAISCEEIVEE